MNEDKLRDELGDGEDFRWMRAILEMLESVLEKDYGHADIVAVMFVVLNYRIVLAGGMVINDDADPNRMVWRCDAAAVASQLDHRSCRSEAWWKGEYGVYPTDSAEFEDAVKRLAFKIARSPLVTSCERI